MRCDRCILEPIDNADPKLPLFHDRISTCDECPLLATEQATPLVHMLVRLHRGAARVIRGLENDVRKAKRAQSAAEAATEVCEERIALLERYQQASTREIEDELRAQLALVNKQRAELNALSVPLIRVWSGVLVLPIIGSIDRERAESIARRLLFEVASMGTAHVILDLTGLEGVDAETTEHLHRLVDALRLLGARTMLSGIRGALAHALVRLDVELPFKTTRTLEEALRSVVSVELSSSGPRRGGDVRARSSAR